VAAGLDGAWDWALECAQAFDEWMAGRESFPPIMTPLVVAARRTSLSRFYPFTSHQVLRFATRDQWWRYGESVVGPVGIGLTSDPDQYVVWRGEFFADQPPTIQLLTADPVEAVDLAVVLVADGGNAVAPAADRF
jgi:hypothetical protein